MKRYPYFSLSEKLPLLLIAAVMVCCFSHVVFGQQHPGRFSPVFSFETFVGNVWSDGQRSDLTGGGGLSYYWYLYQKSEKRQHYFGLDVVTRWMMPGKNEPESSMRRFMEQASLAVLFRWDTQMFAGRDRFWMFAGAGPELRYNRLSKGYFFAPMVQPEAGFTWRARTKSPFLSSIDLGMTCSLPVRSNEWRQGLVFGAVFTRFALF